MIKTWQKINIQNTIVEKKNRDTERERERDKNMIYCSRNSVF